MFAVREEVDIMKEQIKELLEKNTQLELENSILRSAASPDTLSKLPTSTAAAAAASAAAAAAAAAANASTQQQQPATSTT
jgi:regulator of replication initiation timing